VAGGRNAAKRRWSIASRFSCIVARGTFESVIFTSSDEGSGDSPEETPMNRWKRWSGFGLEVGLLSSDLEEDLAGTSSRPTEGFALGWKGFHQPADTTSGDGAADTS
jgi:hypothetical protein